MVLYAEFVENLLNEAATSRGTITQLIEIPLVVVHSIFLLIQIQSLRRVRILLMIIVLVNYQRKQNLE